MTEPKKVDYEIYYKVFCPNSGCEECIYENDDCPSGLWITCEFCGQLVKVI